MPSPLESLVQRLARTAGLQVRTYTPNTSEPLRRRLLLEHHGVDLVFDIGANVGQFASSLLAAGYAGRIVSFEPLPEPHAALVAAASTHPRWTVAERMALGDAEGDILMNVSANSVSSTALDMLDSHLEGAPEARIIRQERAPAHQLDTVAPPYLAEARRPFAKIDVQGLEPRVLDGAAATLPRLVGLELEISLVPLYQGQTRLLPEWLAWAGEHGFALHSLEPAFTHVKTGRVLQVNGIFYRD